MLRSLCFLAFLSFAVTVTAQEPKSPIPKSPEPNSKQILADPERVDVVLDTDAFNEVDDQFAIAFAARSPQRIKLLAVTAAPFQNQRSASPKEGMEKSYLEILRILKLLRQPDDLAVRGANRWMTDAQTPVDNPCARRIIELAKQPRRGPLYVVGLGAATNIASAILMAPEIEERVVVVWIGGHPYHFDDALDFNLKQDIAAAQALFASNVPLVHIPAGDVAEQLSISLPELADGIRGKSTIGDQLYHRVAEYRGEIAELTGRDSDAASWRKIIWDIATIAWLVDSESSVQTNVVRRPGLRHDGTWILDHQSSDPKVRVATDVDRDRVFESLFQALATRSTP